MSKQDIAETTKAFAAAATRAHAAGFRVIEIHAAHGYLLHEFLSPLSNQRADDYGGSFENRTRLLREVAIAIRRVWPEDLPLFTRISATDWVEGGWDIDQSVELARQLKPLGVDLIDCSSGGNVAIAKIPIGPGYQTPFAERIRKDAGILTGCRRHDHDARTGRTHRWHRPGRCRAAGARDAARSVFPAARRQAARAGDHVAGAVSARRAAGREARPPRTRAQKAQITPGPQKAQTAQNMAKKAEATILDVDGRDVSISNPGKVLFPEAGYTKLDLVNYYLAVAEGALRGAGGRPNVLVRYPNGLGQEFFYQKRAPDSRPEWIEVVALKFPVGPHGRRGRAPRCRRARVDGEPGVPRAASASGPRRGARSSRRAARRSRSGAGSRVAAGAGCREGRPRRARRSGTDRLAEDVRLARHSRQRPHSSAVVRSPRCAARPWRWRVKWNAAPRRLRPASGGRKSVTASSSTSTRTRRTRRSARRIRCRPRPDARVSTPLTWDEIDTCDPADFTLKTMPAWFKANGDRHAEIDRHPCSLEKLLELSARRRKKGRATRRGRRSMRSSRASQLACSRHGPPSPRLRRGRLSEGGASRSIRLIVIAHSTKKEEALELLEKWKEENPGVAQLPSAGRHPDRLRCAGDRRPGGASGSTCSTCPKRCGRRQPELPPIPNPWATLLRSRSRSIARCTENVGKLVSRSDLELIVAAVLRRLVVAPAQERRRVPEAIALHVVVLHFAHPLDA